MGSRIRENLESVLLKVRVDGSEIRKDGSGFYRIAGRSIDVVRVPVHGLGGRTVLQVPPEELDLAMTRAVIDAVVTDKEQVSTYVARLLGWRRSGPDIQNALDASLSRLLTGGVLVNSQGGLRAAGG